MTVAAAPLNRLVFSEDRDLIGMRHGIYFEELGRRLVLVSPAIYSLLQSDRAATLLALKVATDDGVVSVSDLVVDGE